MIKVGKIVGVFGIRGEMKFQNYCDGFSSFANIKRVYDKDGNEYCLKYIKPHKNIGILKIEGIDKIEQAELMRNYELFVVKEDLPIADDEFFIDDIIGFAGEGEKGEYIGKLVSFQEIGNKLIYIFEQNILVPSEFVKEINFTKKNIILDLPEGILDINAPA